MRLSAGDTHRRDIPGEALNLAHPVGRKRADAEVSGGGCWRSPGDHALVAVKGRTNRPSFAVLLLFFRERGRFPLDGSEIRSADGGGGLGDPIATEQKTTILAWSTGFAAWKLLETRLRPPDSRRPIRERLSRTRNTENQRLPAEVLASSRNRLFVRAARPEDRCFLLRCYRIPLKSDSLWRSASVLQ